jgi:hypothetical protein
VRIVIKCLCITNSIYHSTRNVTDSASQNRDRSKKEGFLEWVLKGAHCLRQFTQVSQWRETIKTNINCYIDLLSAQ